MEEVIKYGILEAIRRGEVLRSSGIEEVDRFIMDTAMDMIDKGEALESSIEEIGLHQQVYDLAKLKQEFIEFHKWWKFSTKGTKDVLWEKFRRRHKKELAAVVPKLREAAQQQQNWRARAKAAGVFVPEWKMLATWLNQRCWEDELPAINGEDGTEEYHPMYVKYLAWCDCEGFDLRLRQSDYLLWFEGRPPFNNRDTRASKNVQFSIFSMAHSTSQRNRKQVIQNLTAQWKIETD